MHEYSRLRIRWAQSLKSSEDFSIENFVFEEGGFVSIIYFFLISIMFISL